MDKWELALFYGALFYAAISGRFLYETGVMQGLDECARGCAMCDASVMPSHNFMYYGFRSWGNFSLEDGGGYHGEEKELCCAKEGRVYCGPLCGYE